MSARSVPVEPTPEMRAAGNNAMSEAGMASYPDSYLIYKAMLAAAPPAADAVDAKRYRWLRESWLDAEKRQISSVQIYGDEMAYEKLDKAIDAAIAKGG